MKYSFPGAIRILVSNSLLSFNTDKTNAWYLIPRKQPDNLVIGDMQEKNLALLKVPGKILLHMYFVCYFSEKMRLNISCELSARQTVHRKF